MAHQAVTDESLHNFCAVLLDLAVLHVGIRSLFGGLALYSSEPLTGFCVFLNLSRG